MKKTLSIFLFCFCLGYASFAQTTYYPLQETKQVIWGNGFGVNSLTRFPASAQATIPSDVWSNSQRSSGLQVRFKTNATSITVNYSLAAKYSNNSWFSDMGANGLDLYARKPDGKWYWCYPTNRTVGTSFVYSQLVPNDDAYNTDGYEYCLYLPTFATATSLSITVNNGASFILNPVPTDKKPIVVYGTSIVHGAVCSRPGNTWTNIVSRRFADRQIVNLGFSGVGRMESEVIKVINQIDAEVFILDCIPNMDGSSLISLIDSRFTNAIDTLQKYHPTSAILLTEHAGYSDMDMYFTRKQSATNANAILKSVYDKAAAKGWKDIFYMSREELGLEISTDLADYVHPNDKGMYKYADAYTVKLTEILSRTLTSTKELRNEEFKIYPNPNDGNFTIQYSKDLQQSPTVEVLNMYGQLMEKQTLNSKTNNFRLNNMESGNYILKISSNQECLAKTFTVK